MARRGAVLQSEFPYHVSARCINREWFKIPIEEVWEISSDLLYFSEFAFNLRIHSFVLMSNHFHLIVSTPDSNLSEAMSFFLREFTRELNRRSGRINQAFQNRFFRTIIHSNHYFELAYKYVYQNPVRAGIVDRVEDYPFSSLRGLLGIDRPGFPVVEDTLLFEDVERTMKWLNIRADILDSEAIGRALRKTKFKLAKDPITRKSHRLEVDSL